MPVAICEADADTDMFRYTWDGLRLKSFYNGLEDTRYVFDYQNAADRLPIIASVYIGKRIGIQNKPVQIALEYTHTGSLLNVFRCLPDGKKLCIKNVEYTAFGIPIKDSAPNFYFPLGFVGGLFDPYTGFVRFGLRDYDPMLGRFTCPDPARDHGRDGDFYDYCSDDPVNYVDVTGLFSQEAASAGGASHAGIKHPFGAAHSAGASKYTHYNRLLAAASATIITDAENGRPAISKDVDSQTMKNINLRIADWAAKQVPYKVAGKSLDGADCSGAHYRILNEAGAKTPYYPTASFQHLVEQGYFRKLQPGEKPQPGDTVQWKGHIGFYAEGEARDGHIQVSSATSSKGFRVTSSRFWGKPTEFTIYRLQAR